MFLLQQEQDSSFDLANQKDTFTTAGQFSRNKNVLEGVCGIRYAHSIFQQCTDIWI